MKKAQKKPIIIEFIRLTDSNIKEVYEAIHTTKVNTPNLKAQDSWDIYEDIVKNNGMHLKTPESGGETQIASIGDYIVFGNSEKLGRHCWPVKPDYFESAYDIL